MAEITRDVLESFLACKFKAFLKLTGKRGVRSDYEAVYSELQDEVRLNTIDKILARHESDDVERGTPLTVQILKKGVAFVLDATFNDGSMSVHFDGLKKVPGPSKLGDFHYIPMLFHGSRHLHKEQKSVLEFCGLLLSRLQGMFPSNGIVYHGKECTTSKLRLNTPAQDLQKRLDELLRIHSGDLQPRLMLNDHCQVCEFRQQCALQAVKEDNLSLLRGLGEKEIKGYARKGLFTVTQLAHTFRPRRQGKRAAPRKKRYHALTALAIRDNQIYVLGTPDLPTSPVRIYLDIEGNPDEGFVYLIGMIVVAGESETRYSFWADTKDDEARIFQQFMAVVAQHDDFDLFCYGSYEKAFFQRMGKRAGNVAQVNRVLKSLVNTLSLVYSHVYFPVYSNGLKDVGRCLGCTWTDPEASGIQSIAWRLHWEAGKEEKWKKTLTGYNLEDCVALKQITDLMYSIGKDVPPPGRIDGPQIAWVRDIDKLANYRKWGPVQFLHSDFKYINDFAYFDYQRQHVFVRTNKRLRRNKRKPHSHPNRKLRVNKRIRIEAAKCPTCKGTDLIRDGLKQLTTPKTRLKLVLDLVVTPAGTKRRITECKSPVHHCRSCGYTFVPDRYVRLDKHGHSLKSWVVYQHIAHGMGFLRIADMLKEFFTLSISDMELHTVKSLMAEYYRATYRKMLSKLLAGNLLHVDETQVTLKVGKGYVWVFTNLEEVVFIFKPTREGAFVQEMLKDFHGVLVSDFYAAYDSIKCPQQKCLIHLMRDMNQDLLNNPYDQELQSVTQPFGTLLRAVVDTVDKHGLKRRYLKKHDRDVAAYFKQMSSLSLRSEAADALRNRLMKNRDKLFTFVQHDGIPWNNNNAENAIKRFAYYREGTVGTMKETGLTDYLVLLSIFQSCRYKGVSFLKFLLSRERDIDVFGERKRRRRSPALDVYPKGFVHPFEKIKLRKAAESQIADSAAEKAPVTPPF